MSKATAKKLTLLSFLGDLFLLNLVVVFISSAFQPLNLSLEESLVACSLINASWVGLSLVSKIYMINRTAGITDHLKKFYLILFINFSFIFTVFQVLRFAVPESLMLWGLISFTVLASVWRITYIYSLNILRARGYNSSPVLIIGETHEVNRVKAHFNKHPEFGYRVVADYLKKQINTVSDIRQIEAFALKNNIEEIYLCIAGLAPGHLSHLIEIGHRNLIKIKLTTNLGELGPNKLKLENYGSLPVINITSTPLDHLWNRFAKRAFDVVFSLLVIMLVMSWLFPLLAVIIWFTSRGPILFAQQRTGISNQPFTCWKFRTMYVNKEADKKQATSNDNRVTPIGLFLRKTSLDELPQFFNVLIGNMSVVGPRPHMIKHTEEFSQQIGFYNTRLLVKPGITGLAQVKGYRGETYPFHRLNGRVRLDCFYVKNWDFFLDLKIVYRTARTVFAGQENAY